MVAAKFGDAPTAWVFGVLVFASAGICLAMVWPFLPALGWALLLAVIAWPLHVRLGRRIRSPNAAAAVTTTIIAAAIVVPALLVGIRLVREARSLSAINRPAIGSNPRTPRIAAISGLRGALTWVENYVELPETDPEAAIRTTVAEAGRAIGRYSVTVIKNAVWGSVQLAVLVISLFFMFRDGHLAGAFVRSMLPFGREQIDRVLAAVTDTLHAAVIGTGVIAVAQGLLAGAAYFAAGLPSPMLWTVVTIILCLVPVLGAPVIWIPASVLLALQGETGRAVGLALWGLLVVGTVDNLLRPFVIGQRTRMHPLPVFFSILGGTMLMGPLGLFMGPLALAFLAAVEHEWRLLKSTSGACTDGREVALKRAVLK